MNRIWMIAVLIVLGVLGQVHALQARSTEAVALVADVSGKVILAGRSPAGATEAVALRLMQTVVAETRLILAEKSQTTLFFPASGEAFDLFGPGEFLVGNQEVRAIGVAAPTVRRQLNAAFRSIRIDRTDLTQAAIVMRGVNEGEPPELLAPRGIVMTRKALTFRWTSLGDGRQYRFRLMSMSGNLLHEARIHTLELTLPASVTLLPGERYLWSVLDAAPSARRGPTFWHELIVATPELLAEISRLQLDQEPSDIAERNLRELLLGHIQMAKLSASDPAR